MDIWTRLLPGEGWTESLVHRPLWNGQMCSRLQAEPAVQPMLFPLSLVIISRSVGWEIQIRLPEGCKRKNSWTRYKTLPAAHVEDVPTTIYACLLGGSQKLSNRKWSHHAKRWDCQHLDSSHWTPQSWQPTSADSLPSCLESEQHFHLSSRSYSFPVAVTVLRLLSCGVINGYLLYMCWTIVTMHSTSTVTTRSPSSFSRSLAGAKEI